MLLEKVAVYPSRIEIDFLPILKRIFVSFLTSPGWLLEESGVLDIMLESMSGHITIKLMTIQKPTTPKPKIKKKREDSSERIKKWREKLKSDLKRMYDWQQRLWEDIYDTMRYSDVITSMYSMESKRGKVKLITTKNIASPLTIGCGNLGRIHYGHLMLSLQQRNHSYPDIGMNGGNRNGIGTKKKRDSYRK